MSFDEERARRRAARESEVSKQRATDEAAILALEEEQGELLVLRSPGTKAGVATMCAVRPATRSEMNRYRDKSAAFARGAKSAPNAVREAQDALAECCMVYPEKGAERDAFLEAYPTALVSVMLALQSHADLEQEESGKD